MRHRHHFKIRFPFIEVEGAGLGIIAAVLISPLVTWLLFHLLK